MPTPTAPIFSTGLSPELQALADAAKAEQAAEAAKAVAPTAKVDGAIPAPAVTKPKPVVLNDAKPTAPAPSQAKKIEQHRADTLARTGQAAPQTKKIIAEAKALKNNQSVASVPVAPIATKPTAAVPLVSAQPVLPIAPPSAIKSPELLTPIVGKDIVIPGTDVVAARVEGSADTMEPAQAQKNINKEAESREFYKLLGENQKNLPKLSIPEGKKVEKVDLDTLDIPSLADEYMQLQHNPAAVNDQVNPLPTFGVFAAKKWAEKGVSTEQAATVLTQNKVRWDDVTSRAKTELNGLSAYDPEEDKRRFNTWMKRDEVPLTEEMKATKAANEAARKTRVEDLAAATYQPGVTEQTFGIGPVGVVEGADIGVTTDGYSASTLGTHSAAAQHEADKLFAYLTIRSGGEDPRNELEPYIASGNWQAGVEAVAKKLMSASAREGHAMDAEEALRRGFQLIAAMQTKGMWNHIIAFKDVNDPFLKSLGERIGPNRVIVGISGRPGENGKLVSRQETAAAWLMNSALQTPESIVQGGKKTVAAADIEASKVAGFGIDRSQQEAAKLSGNANLYKDSIVQGETVKGSKLSYLDYAEETPEDRDRRLHITNAMSADDVRNDNVIGPSDEVLATADRRYKDKFAEVFMKRIEPEVARAIEERANAVVTNLEIAQQYGVTDPAALGFFGALGFAESIFTPSPVEIASKAKNLTTGYDVIRNGQKIRYNGLVDVLKNTQSYQNTAPYVNHIMEAVNRSAVGRALDADLARGLKNVLHYAPTSADQNIDGHNARKLRDVALIGDDAQMKAQQAGLNTHTANAQTGSVLTALPTDIDKGMGAFEEAQTAVGNALPEMRTHLNRLHGELEQIVERTRGGSLDPLSRQAADALNDADMGEALRRVAVQAESKVKDGQFVGDIEKANMGASFRRSPRGIEADNFEKIYGSRAQLNKVAELKNTSVNGAPLITPVSRQDAITAVQTIMTRNGAVATDPALLALTNKLAEDILDGKLSYNQAKLRIQAFRNQEIKNIQTAFKGNPTQIKLATAQKRLEISDATGKLFKAHKEARVQNYLLKPQELLSITERALWLKHEIRSTAMKVLASHIDNLRIEGGLGDRRSTAALASIQQAAEKGITTGHATEGTPGVWGAMKEAVAARRMKAPPLSPQGLQFRNAIVKAFEGTTHPMSPLQARWIASVTEARARAWATTNGRPMTAYYAEHFGEELNSANMGVSRGTDIAGAKGSTTQLMEAAGQNRRIIEFFKNADFATAMHELAHVFRNDLGSTEMELFALEQRSRGIPVQLDESGREFVSMDAEVFTQMQAIQAKLDDATAAEWNIWVHDIEAVEEDIKAFQRTMRDLRADIKQTKAAEGGADVDLLETQTAKAQTIRAALKTKREEYKALKAQEYSPELVASRVVDLRERMAAEEGMALDLRIQYRLEEDRLIREAAEQIKNDVAEMNSLTDANKGVELVVVGGKVEEATPVVVEADDVTEIKAADVVDDFGDEERAFAQMEDDIATEAARRAKFVPGKKTPEVTAPIPAAAGTPAISPAIASKVKRAPRGSKQTTLDHEAIYRIIFKPGNEVDSYGGGKDIVQSFDYKPDGTWSVTVKGEDGRLRTHNTEPSKATIARYKPEIDAAKEALTGNKAKAVAPKDYVPPTDKQVATAVNATLKQLDGYKDLAENGSKEDIADIKALLNAYIRAKLGQEPGDAMEAAQDFFNKYPTDFAGMSREQFIRQVELDLKAGYGLEAPANVLSSAVAKGGSRKTLYQTDDTTVPTEKRNKLFTALAYAQRGDPERAMERAQMANIAQVYGYTLEHTGDLIHRMTEHPERGHFGYETVKDKVDKVLNRLTNYGSDSRALEKENLRQMKSNFDYHKELGDNKFESFEQMQQKLDQLGAAYAEEHKKLPIYNLAQSYATRAAIALGEMDFSEAIYYLKELQREINKGEDSWIAFAGEVNPRLLAVQENNARYYGRKLYQTDDRNAPYFYSGLERTIEERIPGSFTSIPGKKSAATQAIEAIRKSPLYRAEEDKWVGLTDWLRSKEGQEKIDSSEILGFVMEQTPKVEIKKFEGAGNAKFEQLQVDITAVNTEDDVARVLVSLPSSAPEKLRRDVADYAEAMAAWNYQASLVSAAEWANDGANKLRKEIEVEFPIFETSAEHRMFAELGKYYEDDNSGTHWPTYHLPDGTDQFEILISPNQSEKFNNPHFRGETGTVHIRGQKRVVPDGKGGTKTVLELTEIQNDWAQSKKAQEDRTAILARYGITPEEYREIQRSSMMGTLTEAQLRKTRAMSDADYEALAKANNKFAAQSGDQDIDITLPEYPHKASSSWVELGLKTAIRKAAEDGIDEIRLISGDVVQKIVGGEEGGQLEFYNEIIPNVMDGLGNRIGARVESAPSIEYINGLKRELEDVETAVADSVKRGETPDAEKVKETAKLKPRIAKLEKRRAALGESQTTSTGMLDKERPSTPSIENALYARTTELTPELTAMKVNELETDLSERGLLTEEVRRAVAHWKQVALTMYDARAGKNYAEFSRLASELNYAQDNVKATTNRALSAKLVAPVVRNNPLVIKLSPELMESVKKEGLPLFQDTVNQDTINPSNFTPAVKAEEAFAQQFEQHLLNPDQTASNPVLQGADTWMREVYPTAAVTKPASKEMQEVMDGLFEAKRGFNKPIGKDIATEAKPTKSVALASTELGLRLPRTSNDQSPVETVPAQRIYQKMQEENGDGGKLTVEFITKIGDDENASWRSLPPASRKNALAGVRVVQEVTGNASRLVVEAVERRGVGFAHEDEALLAYLDGTSIDKLDSAGNVVSTSLVRYANGSVVPTAGYAPAAEIKAQIAMVWNELPLEDQEFILRIAKQTVLSDADQKGMRALYNRGNTAKGKVRKYGLLKPPIMQSAMKGIHDKDFKEVSKLTPDALIWLARIYAHQVNPPANSISATSTLLMDLGAPIGNPKNKKTNPGEAKGRAAVLIAAHGGAKFAAKTWTERKLGLVRNEVEALQDWLHGRDITLTRDEIKAARVQAKLNNLPKDSLLPQALLDKQKRIPLLAQTFGLDTTNMAKMDELGLTSFGTTYWPAMARKKLGDVITQAESPLTPAMQAALAAGKTMDEARNEKGPMTALRFMVSRLQAVRTSGLFANRPQYFAANLWGDTSQGFVAATNTFRISAANFIRTLPQLMVTNTPIGSAAGAVIQAGEQAARAGAEAISDVAADMKAGGMRDKAQGIARADAVIPAKYEEFRRVLQNAGDRAAIAISGARFDIRVNKILDRSTEMVPGTDFTYAQFADKMIETGVFASFDASEMERALYTIMTEDSKGAGRMGQAFLIADRDMRRVNRDLAENLTLRSRLGTAITLVSKYAEDAAAAGRPPLNLADAGQVGDLTTNVLYDYANTMSGWDKHILTKMFFPYQAWRKNNARFFLENLQDPQMVTRMSRLYKFEQNGGRLLTEAMYYIHADPYGVNTEELNEDQKDLYNQFVYHLEFGRGPVESWNYSQKQDVLYAINKERAPEEKYNNFADAWAGLDEQEKRILVAGYGGPENVPYDVRMGVRQMFGGRGVVTEENSAYQFTPVTDDRGVDILTAAESHEGVGQIDKAVPEKPNRNDLSAYADTRAVVGFTPRRVMVGDVPWIIAPECFVVDPMTNYAAMYEGAHLGMWSVNGFLNDTGTPTKQNWLEVAKHVMEPGRSTGLGPILQYIEDDSQSTEIPVGVGEWMVGTNFAPEWLIKHSPGEVDTNGKVTKAERYYLQPGMSMLFDNVFVTAPVFGLAPEMNRELKRISTRERTPAEFNADKYSMLGIVPEAVRQTGIANITNTSEEKAVRASDLEVETTTNDPAKIRP